MKTRLACLLLALGAAPVAAGSDFVARDRAPRALAASDGELVIEPQDDITFAHDSHALGPAAIVQIDSAARWLAPRPHYRIVLEGYADYTGDPWYNEDLAIRRATMVRNHLIARGVRPDNIIIVAFGEVGARPENATLDRRVVLYATQFELRDIVNESLDHKRALTVAWTAAGARLSEERTSRTVARDLVSQDRPRPVQISRR